MDYAWVAVAFACGFLAKQINLPPLVGYLGAGFGLHALGVKPDASFEALSHLGITLLLFTIGLRLNINNLLKTEIWAGASSHMVATLALTTLTCMFFGYLGVEYFDLLDWSSAALIGFALSFSSTVCAVKFLEDSGEMRTRHGQVAIGILIIQDIAAVIFLALATDKSPSLWALFLLGLPLIRPVLYRLLERCGHGETLTLMGFFLAYSGSELFEFANLEPHVGALVVAVLMSGHAKATELAKALLSFKDIFLIGFFLSIGFTALPTATMFMAALTVTLGLAAKGGLLFVLLTRLKLRSRSSFLASLSLTNFSEFGLIVCSVGVARGLLDKEWLVIVALAVAISFVVTSIVNIRTHSLFERWGEWMRRFERSERLPEDLFSHPGSASILVIGMGRVGTGAYDALRDYDQRDICGIDVDRERAATHCEAGRHVIAGDAEDPDFWAHINLNAISLIMFTLPNHPDTLQVVKQIHQAGYSGKTAGIAHYEDEKKELLAAGVDVVFNFYANAGAGLTEHSMHLAE
ncbi:MAG: cation:proton antiporter [Kordiimonas sp.]